MSETEKLRLGGMALRNGLLVHGPTHWAAAVRARRHDRRRLGAQAALHGRVDGVPGVRGVVRLGEAMAVIPLVKRALPEARLPFQDARSWRRGGRRRRRAAAHARGGRWRGEAAVAALSVCRRSSRCAAATSPPTTASSTRRSPPTSATTTTRATPPRSTTAAARTSWRRCSPPTSRASRCCASAVERPVAAGRRRGGGRVGRRRRRGLRLVRAPRRLARRARAAPPGHELQRAVGTREPTARSSRSAAPRSPRSCAADVRRSAIPGDARGRLRAAAGSARATPRQRTSTREGARAWPTTSCATCAPFHPGGRRGGMGEARRPGARQERSRTPRRRLRAVVRGRPLRPAADHPDPRRLAPRRAAERITLICIGEYPGIARFGGLGELTAEQLRELPDDQARRAS